MDLTDRTHNLTKKALIRESCCLCAGKLAGNVGPTAVIEESFRYRNKLTITLATTHQDD